MKNIIVFFGGPSVEHSVSIVSTQAVINGLDRKKYRVYPVYISEAGIYHNLGEFKEKTEDLASLCPKKDELTIAQSIAKFLTEFDFDPENTVIYPMVHGTYGEDGCLQGFIEMLDVPYIGSNVISSALCMDKVYCNDVFEQYGIPQSKYDVVHRHNLDSIDQEKMIDYLGLPLYIKPANGGSSVGVVRVTKKEDFYPGLKEALKYDRKVVVEEEIWGRELNVSVIGNENPKASVPGDYEMETGYFDYDLKYNNPKIVPIIPAKIPEKFFPEIAELAEKSYALLGCRGTARIDIFFTEDEKLFVNEINTIPGMSALSMTPVLWEATSGISYPDLLDKFVNWAIEEYSKKKDVIRIFE